MQNMHTCIVHVWMGISTIESLDYRRWSLSFAWEAVICIAYTDDIPKSEKDMNSPGLDVAVMYTVWSYKKGAGRELVLQALNMLKASKPMVTRYVTLSPLTDTATRFHQRNGALNIGIHKDCQNFEYY